MNKIKLSLDVSFYDFEKVHRSVSESIDLEAENIGDIIRSGRLNILLYNIRKKHRITDHIESFKLNLNLENQI